MAEFDIIAQYFKDLTPIHAGDIGIGDDAAVTTLPPHQQLISCMDTLIAGRHFPHDTAPHAIGWKSVAVNLSDLAAMGATAHSILLALSLPRVDHQWLAEFSRGIAACCQQFGVSLIGGDTTRSELLTISVTALGAVPHGQALLRSGAQLGDMVCVSGEIGSAAYALANLIQDQPTTLQAALDYPQPQLALGHILRDYASSAIDISDGLAQDLGHILTASALGARVELERIPCAVELEQLDMLHKWQLQLNGGDDYQLCFTLPTHHYHCLKARYPTQLYAIGEIVAERGLHLVYRQQPMAIPIQGWQHF